MSVLFPKLDILPEAQKILWPLLKDVPKNFVLYGGTAVALRYGHRQSIDFDFFSSQNKPGSLEQVKNLPFIKKFNGVTKDIEQGKSGYQIIFNLPIKNDGGTVEVTFLDHEKFMPGAIKSPDKAMGNNLLIASPDDLMATKIKVIAERESVKDYVDICVMIQQGVSFSKGFEVALILKKETLSDDIHDFNALNISLRDPENIEDIFRHTQDKALLEFLPLAKKVIPKAVQSLDIGKLLKSKLKLTKDLSHGEGRKICRSGR